MPGFDPRTDTGIPTEPVGSLPRPAQLQAAYAEYDAGSLYRIGGVGLSVRISLRMHSILSAVSLATKSESDEAWAFTQASFSA